MLRFLPIKENPLVTKRRKENTLDIHLYQIKYKNVNIFLFTFYILSERGILSE